MNSGQAADLTEIMIELLGLALLRLLRFCHLLLTTELSNRLGDDRPVVACKFKQILKRGNHTNLVTAICNCSGTDPVSDLLAAEMLV